MSEVLSGLYGADPDAVVSLAAHVGREWSYGVRIVELSGLPGGGAVAVCSHSDGSRWFVACDRYACDVVDADTFEAVCVTLSRVKRDSDPMRAFT